MSSEILDLFRDLRYNRADAPPIPGCGREIRQRAARHLAVRAAGTRSSRPRTWHDAGMSHPRIEFEADVFSPTGLTLLVDGTAQSHVDPSDPTRLFFEYMRRLGHVLDTVAPAGEPNGRASRNWMGLI